MFKSFVSKIKVIHMEEIEEIAKKRLKDGWIKVWFAIEAMAAEKNVVEDAMKKHIESMSKVKDLLILEKNFKDTKEVEKEKLPKGIEKAFSQVAEVTLIVKDLFTLINVIILYGPSSIEIIEPDKKEIKIDEMQNLANLIAGIIHQFAAAGVGGIVMTGSSQ